MRASDRQARCCVDWSAARPGGTIGQGFRTAGHSGRWTLLQEIRRRGSGVVAISCEIRGGMIMDKLNDGSPRPEPAAAGPRAMIDSARERNRRAFFALVSRRLKGLQHFVRHQLCSEQAVGDLRRGELDPEDVVDAILLRAYREFVKAPPAGPLRRWLFGLAREQVGGRDPRSARRPARERTPLRTEHDVPETHRKRRCPRWATRSWTSTSPTRTSSSRTSSRTCS